MDTAHSSRWIRVRTVYLISLYSTGSPFARGPFCSWPPLMFYLKNYRTFVVVGLFKNGTLSTVQGGGSGGTLFLAAQGATFGGWATGAGFNSSGSLTMLAAIGRTKT